MTFEQIIAIAAKEGVGTLAVVGGIWLLFYLVKHTVVRLGGILDRLANRVDVLATRIEKDHGSQDKRSEELLIQHREITDILKSINNRTK